ncbi:MAG: HDIG domain-containing protein [Prevotella sp.]|nr:HDIG domain-containing protein [Prevotella sp.]
MKKIKTPQLTETHILRNTSTRVILVMLSVALIVWFLPRTSGSHLHYDIGKPWVYGSIIADFDFPIYKSDEVLKHEQDSVLALYEPYYNYNAEMEKTQTARFLNDYKDGIPELGKEYVRIIADILHHIYQSGIVSTTDYSRVHKDSTSMIRIVNGKSATSIYTSNIYSQMSAYETLFDDSRLTAHRPILQRCNLDEYIHPNLTYDVELNRTEQEDLLSAIPIANGMVLSGQKIIDRGDIVDEHTYRVLNSFEKETQRRSNVTDEISSTVAGQVLFVSVLIIIFTTYLTLFRRDYFGKPRSLTMLYAMITIFPIIVSLMMEHLFMSVYIVPFAMAPIFIRVFMDSRTAFVTHLIMILICAAAVKYQYEFIIVQLVAGLTAIYSLRELSQRAQMFRTALLVTIASCVVYLSLQLMQDYSIYDIDQSMYRHFIINGVLLLFTYPLMLVIEKLFGFISYVTLIELSNTNKDLLQRLSEVAPGTFQHSIMVSNLAAEIATKIEAKALLVRTGALYHDIGKISNPVFYTENQAGVNPLDKMSRPDAAKTIINHVAEGIKLAEKYNLPKVIKDFIYTHHGEGKAKFFYIAYKNEHPDEVIDETPFLYPGPNPSTREQAVLMMADSVEAASRSLPEYTEESISQLVNRIIDGQTADGFFRDCPITFHDIAVAKQVLIERLKSIYHTRISYPEQK